MGVYATAKYAVVGLSEHLRIDLARHQIGVSVLCPGGVQTQILRSERNRPPELGASQNSEDDLRKMAAGAERHPEELKPPEAIAAAVLEGIRSNDAYIFTHAHYREKVEARCANLMRAFDQADARTTPRRLPLPDPDRLLEEIGEIETRVGILS